MRKLLSALLSLTFFLTAISRPAHGAGVSFKADYREAANVFTILDCVSAWWDGTYCYDDGTYRKEWEARFGLSEEDKAVFQKYDAFRQRHFRGLGAPKAAEGKHGDGIFAKRASINEDLVGPAFYSSRTLDEALGKLRKIVSAEDLEFLKSFYARFKAGTDKLLEESAAFAAKAKLLNRSLSNPGFGDFFDRLSRYYSVSEEVKYEVLYTWFPPLDRDIAAPVDRYLVLSQNPLKHLASKDEDVIFHEVVHTLSKRQPQEQKEAISAAFLEACPMESAFPKGMRGRLLEEPLAVAVGQILFLKEFFPKRLIWDSKLYNHPWVSAFAKLIYPVIDDDFKAKQTFGVETGKRLGTLCAEFLKAGEALSGKDR